MRNTLSAVEAKAFYDRFGSRQDAQAFYEDAALDDLIAHADFASARHVFELGCGTGRLAERLLRDHCALDATYDGVDVSTTMVGLARRRLQPFGARARVEPVNAMDPFAGVRERPDRVLTTYVVDLLPAAEIISFLDCAARVLEPGGRICISSLTFGETPLARAVTAGWRALFRVSPRIVGGCRPVRLLPFLTERTWDVLHRRVVTSFGIASEVVVAVVGPHGSM